MRHNKKRGMKLGTDASHTKAIKKSLIQALFTNDRIKTLDVRAKAVRGEVDKVITWAKRGDLHARRLAMAKVGNAELVREVFDKAAQGMWADRNGGYTRILKIGFREGDAADVAILELVDYDFEKKEKDTKKKDDSKKSDDKKASKKEAGFKSSKAESEHKKNTDQVVDSSSNRRYNRVKGS